MHIVQRLGHYPRISQLHHNLPSMVRGMIDDMKKDVLQFI